MSFSHFAENRAEAKEQSLCWPLPCFQPWAALWLHSCRAIPSARQRHCITWKTGNLRNLLRFRMTHSNVKEFREEDSTLNQASFLSKNLDHLIKFTSANCSKKCLASVQDVFPGTIPHQQGKKQSELVLSKVSAYFTPSVGSIVGNGVQVAGSGVSVGV